MIETRHSVLMNRLDSYGNRNVPIGKSAGLKLTGTGSRPYPLARRTLKLHPFTLLIGEAFNLTIYSTYRVICLPQPLSKSDSD